MAVCSETKKTCWPLLRQYGDEKTCLVPNVLDFMTQPFCRLANNRGASPQDKLDRLAKYVVQSKAGKLFDRSKRGVWCANHGKQCHRRLALDLVGGGSECTDFSVVGKKKGTDGSSFPATLAMVAQLAEARQGLHENVSAFPTNIVEDTLARTHRVYCLPVTPGDHGFKQIVKRPRVYRLTVANRAKMAPTPNKILFHKCCAVALTSVLFDSDSE